MEKIHFSLELRDENKFTKILQVVLGIVCIAIAGYWLVYNLNTASAEWKIWATVCFLSLFGIYQILTGAGLSGRFFETEGDTIRIKKSSLMPARRIFSKEIDNIEIFPLKVHFNTKQGRLLFRLGVVEIEKGEMIKEAIIHFSERNNIRCEIKADS